MAVIWWVIVGVFLVGAVPCVFYVLDVLGGAFWWCAVVLVYFVPVGGVGVAGVDGWGDVVGCECCPFSSAWSAGAAFFSVGWCVAAECVVAYFFAGGAGFSNCGGDELAFG